MTRRARVIVLLAGLLGGIVLAVAGVPGRVASAHARLTSSSPAANAVLEAPPTQIVLTFDEDVVASTASVRLFDQRGAAQRVGTVASAGDPTSLAAPVSGLGTGPFVVVWQVASADGHLVDGAFAFQVGAAGRVDNQALIDRVLAGAGGSAAVVRLADAFRLLSMLGLVICVGAGGWAATTGAAVAAARRSRALLWVGAVLALVGALELLVWYGVRLRAGAFGDGFHLLGLRQALTTHAGQLYLLRAGMAAVWVVLLLAAARRTEGWWRILGFVSAAVALVTYSASGHPNATHPASLWIAVDLIHLAAVTVWLGGLVLFAVDRRWFDESTGAVVRRFSTAATITVPLVVVTGVAQTWKLAGGFHDPTATTWGRYLLAKLALATVLVTIGGVSRWALRRLDLASIRRTVAVEAVLAVAVVGVAAGLVSAAPRAGVPARATSATLTEAGLIVDVNVGPGRVGSNELHVIITPPGGSLQPVLAAEARAANADRQLPNAPIALQRLGPNHYSGSWIVPASGSWTLQIIVHPTAGSTVQLQTVVPIP